MTPHSILEIGEQLGLRKDELIPHGQYKAKVSLDVLARLADRPRGRYVLVTAVNPTPLGEGKTTTAVGLVMGLCRLGRRAVVNLRQPSLGPVFGLKGGGAGGGRACIVPMEEMNLHLTGDAHAVQSAHNLLSAFVDNHLFHDNTLELDPKQVTWPRAVSVSDRALRRVHIIGKNGEEREARFVLTEASEVMALLALATSLADLRARLGRIVVGVAGDGWPVTADDLRCAGAMAALLKNALCPNLLQTVEGTPAFVHAGPFGNIAHGNSSVLADMLALRCADYVVTESGFASELGAEKFFNIKCRTSGLTPDAAVIVVTLRALKFYGDGGEVKFGQPVPAGLTGPNRDALARGFANLEQHLANVRVHGVPAVVAVNAFDQDSDDELRWVCEQAEKAGATGAVVTTHFRDGGKGSEALAHAVMAACRQPNRFAPLYDVAWPIKRKIDTIATRMYGAAGVSYGVQAEQDIERATRWGFDRWPICMAKTPLSLSHDPALKGRPSGFTVPITELRVLAGAGFLTAVCSGIELLPGLPTHPSGEHIDLDPVTGEIVGLT
ncbi:MAG: formate--tetrahydrofolate ligase [Nitrospirae bacterium]|nr:formate--tetrahydrofolate ligase [Nitrospirota bacterium]